MNTPPILQYLFAFSSAVNFAFLFPVAMQYRRNMARCRVAGSDVSAPANQQRGFAARLWQERHMAAWGLGTWLAGVSAWYGWGWVFN